MTWQIVRADARTLPIEDASVDLIVSSPPYWGLRSYRDGGKHYDGQVGSEVTPQQYVDELVGMIDGEWRRVLKPSGSLFLNLGDKYAGSGGGNGNTGLGFARGDQGDSADSRGNPRRYRQGTSSARPKSLLGLPWRVALALIDRGWILRAEIIWAKPNGLPESVQDRVRRSHEQVFHFALEPRYYSAVDEVREPASTAGRPGRRGSYPPGCASGMDGPSERIPESWAGMTLNPLGRLPGSVWQIATSPLIIPDQAKQHYQLPDHFAAYPPELVRRIVLGWSPVGGTVCDPMCGTGTTVGVAHRLGRHGIGVDLSEDYCRLARWRVAHSGDFDMVESKTWRDRQEGLF